MGKQQEVSQANRRSKDHSRLQGIIDGVIVAGILAGITLVVDLRDSIGELNNVDSRHNLELKSIKDANQDHENRIRKIEWILPTLKRNE